MDLTQVEIAGPCRITWGAIDIGHTLDGVELLVDRKMNPVLVDRYGESPVDYVISGTIAKVKFKLAQWGDRTWDMALPEGQNIDTPLYDQTGFGTDAGYSLRGDAKQLIVHPLKYAVGDFSHDVTLYLAVNTNNVSLPFKIKDQLAVDIEMEALVSEQFGTLRRLGHIGYAATS